MRIGQNGYVGIGTTNPSTRLHVDGQISYSKNWARFYRNFSLSLSSLQTFVDINFVSDDIGWVINNYEIYKTTNGGVDWILQYSEPHLYPNCIYFVSENKGWIGGGSGNFLMTEDGGETWKPNELLEYASLNSIYFLNENLGWIVGYRNYSIHRSNTSVNERFISKTTNGGKSWVNQSFDIKSIPLSVKFNSEELI